jgi:hypothetical protein
MEKVIRWMIKRFLKGYHLSKSPEKGKKRKVKKDEAIEKLPT